MPLLTSVQDAGSLSHFAALRNVLESAAAQGRETLYSSRFVLKKEARTDRVLANLFKEMVAGVTYADFVRFEKPQIVAGSALRFKTQAMFEQVGFRPLAWQNEPLEPFIHANSGEKILLMKVDEISAWSKECFEKHQATIDSRLMIVAEGTPLQDGKVAA